MKKLYPKVSMEELCGLFGYSRQNYYKISRNYNIRKSYEEQILKEVKEIRKDQPRIGTVKLQVLVNQSSEEISIGRDKLYDLLRSKRMLIRRKKKYRPKETNGDGKSIYPDLRKGLKLNRINQLWCSDITYINIRTKEKHCYLIAVTDEYSHLIVGYHLGLRMRTEELLMAMDMALRQELELGEQVFKKPMIIHSDRGAQYKSERFKSYCKQHNITCSMTAAGKSYENPVAERLNGILKDELLSQDYFDSFEQAKKAIDKAIKIYNEKRPHLSCNLLTPQQAHQQKEGPLKKLWRQRKNAKKNNKV